MASTYTGLGTQLMTTGEKAGTWGTLTNTNWNISEQIAGGYIEVDINGGAQTTTLTVSDGTAGATLANRVIKLTGAITGNQIVTIPLDVQTFYIIKNSTSGSFTVQFKYVSGSGSSVTFAGGDRGTKIVYGGGAGDDATNPNIVDATSAFITATSTTTLTNKTLTSPKIGTAILDTNGLELALLTATGTAVNEFTIANAATTAGPTLSATGGDANVPINITPKGTGDVFINPVSSGSLVVKGNATQGGKLKLFEDTDLGAYHTGFTTGNLTEDIVYTLPLADAGTSGDALTSNSSGTLSWTTMSGGTSWQAVETGSTMTAVAGNGYPINTTSNACTITLPSSASNGDEIIFADYARNWGTNGIVIDSNGLNYQGQDDSYDVEYGTDGQTVHIVYSGATNGWIPILDKVVSDVPSKGNQNGIFAYGSSVSMSNLVSSAGVVATDTSGVGTVRYGLAACSYGDDKGIFGYGTTGSVSSLTNLVSNVGVVATDVTGVGTARRDLAAPQYGGDKAIFGYGNSGSYVSLTNLVSNVGVVATDVTGVGTVRKGSAACSYN